MQRISYTLLVLLTALPYTIEQSLIPIDSGREAFILVGHFDLRYAEEWQCSTVEPTLGVMFVEAAIYAVNKVNADPNLMHGTKFTLQIWDTCGQAKKNAYNAIVNSAVGIIGPYSSELTKFITTFVEVFDITTVSYGATATSLSRRDLYAHCFRTVPVDSFSTYVYENLITTFNWQYSIVFYTDNEDGGVMSELVSLVLDKRLGCFLIQEGFKDTDQLDVYKESIQRLFHQNPNNARVIFLFLSVQGCRHFFKAATYFTNELKTFQIVLGTQCGTVVPIPTSLQPVFNGALVVQISKPMPDDFKDYFTTLTPSSDKWKKWNDWDKWNLNAFKRYWEITYNCSFPDISPGSVKSPCQAHNNTRFNQHAPVRPVIEAVYKVAEGITRGLETECFHDVDKEACYQRGRTKRRVQRSLHEEFYAENKTNLFNDFGSVNSDLDILQLRLLDNNDTVHTSQKYEFIKVGFWNYTNFVRNSSSYSIEWKYDLNLTSSICSKPCEWLEIKQLIDAYGCCWRCIKCEQYQIIQKNKCITCKQGFIANENHTDCLPLPVQKLKASNTLSIVVIVLSAIGILMSVIISLVYIKNYNIPLIKATSRELALFSLFGLDLMLITAMILVIEPSQFTCGSQKIMFGFSLVCCYAPLVLKTNRIYRIFVSSHKFKLKRLVMVSMMSQFLLMAAMVGIQLLLGIYWLLTDTPHVRIEYPDDTDYIVYRCGFAGTSLALNLMFPAALMIASTFWAFKTRNLPETFSEIKSIGVTMYFTLFIATCALALQFALRSFNWLFGDIYIICFSYQLIVLVTFIGQYAQKVKMIYLEETLEINPTADNHTEITTMSINGPQSPLPVARSLNLQRSHNDFGNFGNNASVIGNRHFGSTYSIPASPKTKVKTFDLDV